MHAARTSDDAVQGRTLVGNGTIRVRIGASRIRKQTLHAIWLGSAPNTSVGWLVSSAWRLLVDGSAKPLIPPD
jgi:hypothetical protein